MFKRMIYSGDELITVNLPSPSLLCSTGQWGWSGREEKKRLRKARSTRVVSWKTRPQFPQVDFPGSLLGVHGEASKFHCPMGPCPICLLQYASTCCHRLRQKQEEVGRLQSIVSMPCGNIKKFDNSTSRVIAFIEMYLPWISGLWIRGLIRLLGQEFPSREGRMAYAFGAMRNSAHGTGV